MPRQRAQPAHAHVERHERDAADQGDHAGPPGGHHPDAVGRQRHHAHAGEPREPEPGLCQLEGQAREPDHQQEIDHRGRGHAVRHPLRRPHGVEPDVDRALAGLLLGWSRCGSAVRQARAGSARSRPSTTSSSSGTDCATDGGDAEDPARPGPAAASSVVPGSCPCRVRPASPGSCRVESRILLIGLGEVDRIAGAPSASRATTAVRAEAYISSSPAPLARAGSGSNPGDHRHVQVGYPLGQRDPVLIDGARRVDLQDHGGAVGLR